MLDHLKKLGVLKALARNAVPENHNVFGFHAMRDGSPVMFGVTLYIMTYHNKDPAIGSSDGPKLHHNIMGSKSRLSLKTVPVNEALSTPLSASFLTKTSTGLLTDLDMNEKKERLFLN